MYITYDLTTALVVFGALTVGVLVYRRTEPSEGASTLSRGERLVLALGAAATVVAIGSYLGNGLRGIERTSAPKPTETVGVLGFGVEVGPVGGTTEHQAVSTTAPPPAMSRVAS